MKKLLTTIILLVTIGFIVTYYEEITKFIMYNFIYKDDLKKTEANEYHRDTKWNFVNETDDFEPNNRQDILNILYTTLNNGWDEITFFCPKEYENCSNDVENITNDSTLVSNINNFAPIYNNYDKISVNINNFGRINIKIDYLYSNEDIIKLKNKVNEIYDSIITDSMTDVEKITTIHDYIINNTKYDEERSNQIKSGNYNTLKHTSNTASGPLFTGKAICGGYTDAMALFLDKMGLPNYKISSESHIWNLVYINNEWKHIDLTWDDPVVSTGEDAITDIFLLISTKELEEKATEQHIFDKNVFIEAN